MFVKPFRYLRAESLAEAAAMLRDGAGSAKVMAGGQSLLPMLNLGILDLDAVIDIAHVQQPAASVDDGYLSVGSLTTHRELAAAGQPLVAAAVRWVGSSRIRARGTIGGSLAHSDPAAELPLAMVVAGAEYDCTNGASTRTVKATDFHESFFTTTLGDDELIERVRIPVLGPGWGWGFAEISRRRGDFAIVAAAALVRVVDGAVVESRVGLAGVADRPVRLGAVEIAVTGADAATITERVGSIDGLETMSDTSATAEHRRRLAHVLTRRALADAATRTAEAA